MFENIHKNTFLVFILIYIKKYNKPYSSVWLERGANNAKVVGSIPTVAIFLKEILCLMRLLLNAFSYSTSSYLHALCKYI